VTVPIECPRQKSPPQRAVSRILFPASALSGIGEVTTIPLVPSLLTGSSGLPGGFGRAVLKTPPYLALLRAGFCLPPVLPRARCALTAPFHPYPSTRPFGPRSGRALWSLFRTLTIRQPYRIANELRSLPRARPGGPSREAVCFLCHCPSGRPDRELPGALPFGVRTFLPSTRLFEARSGQAPCQSQARIA
jgi:hypothetical protein